MVVLNGQERRFGLEGMALGGSQVPTFTALPTLSSPCISLSFSSTAGQTLFPVALQLEKPCSKARPVSYLSVPSLGEAQSLRSGELSVSPTLRWTGGCPMSPG